MRPRRRAPPLFGRRLAVPRRLTAAAAHKRSTTHDSRSPSPRLPPGYERRFRELQAAVAARFPGAPLTFSSEGTPQATGWFEVFVDGALVFSKKNGGGLWVIMILSACRGVEKAAAERPPQPRFASQTSSTALRLGACPARLPALASKTWWGSLLLSFHCPQMATGTLTPSGSACSRR